ncbi:MAG: flippase [Candidatus Uhrbacteria bacterium]
MSLMKTVAKNYLVQLFGKFFSLTSGLLVIALLGRYLDDANWAAFITATSVLSFVAVFVDFGLTLTLTQMISAPNADEKKITGGVLGFRLVSGGLFYALSAVVVIFLPYSAAAKAAVAAGTAAYFFLSAAGSLVGVFQKHLAIKKFVIAELVSRGIYLVLTLVCVFLGWGLLPILGAMGIANGLWLIFVIMAAESLTVIRPKIDLKIWHEAFSRSTPIALSTIFNLIYLRGDVLILSWLKQDEVGQYGAAYKLVDVATTFPTMFMGLILPQLTLAWAENKENFKNILQKSFDIFALSVIPLFFGTQIVAVPLTLLITGPKFATAGLVLKILVIAIVCVFFSSLYGHTVLAIRKQKIMTIGYAVTAVISVIGYLIFIPKFGMWGAAWVTCFSELAIAALTFLMVSWTTKILPNLKITIKALAAGLFMYFVLLSLPTTPVVITIIIGALIYATIIILIGGIKISDLKSLLPKNQNHPSTFAKAMVDPPKPGDGG